MIPLKDENPTTRFPLVTILLIVANVGIYFLVQKGPVEFLASTDPNTARQEQVEDARFNFRYAAIPEEVTSGEPLTLQEVADTVGPDVVGICQIDAQTADPSDECFPEKSVWPPLFFSMFLHGGLLHLGGNMLFLWIFGNNIEDHLGVVRYLLFYLAAGIVASIAHIAAQPGSEVPVVGASGAIAGVMGAYLVWFPSAQIRTIIIFFFILFRDISAKWLLGFWFVSQFFVNPNEGVAWVAHVGGFVFGALVALLVKRSVMAQHAMWRSDRYQSPDHWDPTGGSFRRSDTWRRNPWD